MRRLLAALVIFGVGCSTNARTDTSPPEPADSPKVYEVVRVESPSVQLDGVLDEPVWQRANVETDFLFPWRDRKAPPTAFRAVCDGETLYFAFEVEDEDVVVDDKTPGEKALIGEDRVEFYFAPDLNLKKYYSVEMDFKGRKLDYLARFHRQFDFDWEFPGIETGGKRTGKGYTIEGKIPLSVLESLGLPSLDSGKLRVGVFRAEFSHGEGEAPIENWISWVDPKTEEEDFHVPGTFGVFKAVDSAGDGVEVEKPE